MFRAQTRDLGGHPNPRRSRRAGAAPSRYRPLRRHESSKRVSGPAEAAIAEHIVPVLSGYHPCFLGTPLGGHAAIGCTDDLNRRCHSYFFSFMQAKHLDAFFQGAGVLTEAATSRYRLDRRHETPTGQDVETTNPPDPDSSASTPYPFTVCPLSLGVHAK